MLAPVRVTAPAVLPVSLNEAKAHLRVDHDDDDALIEAYLAAAVDHLDGWTGILGRCLVEQEWRQDFEVFARCLPLPLGPVISITAVSHTDDAGEAVTVEVDDYALKVDAGGRARVELAGGVSISGSVSVTYKSGYRNTAGDEATSTVPPAIKTAIMLMVSNWYQNSSAVNVGNIVNEMPFGVAALIGPYRRPGV